MSRLQRVLLWTLLAAVCFAAASFGLTQAVAYKPFGVPDHRRAEYEQKIDELIRQRDLARAPGAKPIVRATETSHDFGLLSPHSTARHTFSIFNDGQSPLELEVLDSTCKCTVGKLKQRFVEPGQSTTVTLTWNTGYQDETYAQSVTLGTNDPLKKTITLRVSGTVKAELVLPESLPMSRCQFGGISEGSFLVYSQQWPSFVIDDIESDLNHFQWSVEPVSVDDARLGDAQAAAAWHVTIASQRISYGKFDDEIRVRVDPRTGGDKITRTLCVAGKVKPPISFVSPQLHKNEGLVLGTMVAGTRHDFHVNVQARNVGRRKIEVLDFQPRELEVSIAPMQRDGSYRLTISIPPDCPRVIFHADHQHGYVQVGDPRDKSFSNWFPLRGAVCKPQ